MKKILSLAVASFLTLGFTLSAATLPDQNSSDNKEKKEQKVQKGNRNAKAKLNKFNPFEGLNLTQDQQNALKALKPEKGEKQESRQASCCKGDSAACCKGKGQACCQFNPEQAKKLAVERLAKIKTILTPEQYQQYLENIAVNSMLKNNKPGARLKNDPRNRHSSRKGRKAPTVKPQQPKTDNNG